MARDPGYERVACDRAEKVHAGGVLPVEYMKPEDKRNAEWMDIEYTDAHGVDIRMTLCPDCARDYRAIQGSHAREITEFAEKGRW